MDLKFASKQNFEKSLVAPRKNNLWRPWSSPLQSVPNSRHCVFCGALLKNDFCYRKGNRRQKVDFESSEKLAAAALSQGTLVQGVSILCDILNSRSDNNNENVDAKKLANLEKWALEGVDNFVGLVCCKKCNEVLVNVVSLHKLVLKKEERVLDKSGGLIADCTDNRKTLKRSVNTCDGFELGEEFIENISLQIEECARKLGLTSAGQTVEDTINDNIEFTDYAYKRSFFPPTDAIYQYPITGYEIPAKRVKTSYPSRSAETVEKLRRLLGKNFLDKEQAQKQDRKEVLGDTKNNLVCNNVSIQGDLEGLPKKNNDFAARTLHYKPEAPEKGLLISQTATQTISKSDNKTLDSLLEKLVYKDVYENDEPIFVLHTSLSLFMYLNVKFGKTLDVLRCLHPDCNYSESISGHFADQLSFEKFRFHVKCEHRSRKNDPSVSSSTKKFYYCYLCEHQLDSQVNLLNHQDNLHPNFKAPPVLCEVCGDTMPHCNIVNHVISHKSDEEKKIVLNQYNTAAVRQQEESRKQLTTIVSCAICGECFAELSAVEEHKVKAHKPDNFFECKFCSKKYNSDRKALFLMHLRSHTGERPYKCSTCGKRFANKYVHKNHEMLRHANKCHDCGFCSKSFTCSQYLRRHQLSQHSELMRELDLTKTAKPELPTEYNREEING